MVKSIPIISNDLSCQVGRGFQNFLGIDLICGLGDNYLLSHGLVLELHRKNLYVLKYVHWDSCNNIWVNSKVLGLSGRLSEEWDMYIYFLNQRNITLSINSASWFGHTKPEKDKRLQS